MEIRGGRDLNPRGPLGHRLSRPAPYQAREPPPIFSMSFLIYSVFAVNLFRLVEFSL